MVFATIAIGMVAFASSSNYLVAMIGTFKADDGSELKADVVELPNGMFLATLDLADGRLIQHEARSFAYALLGVQHQWERAGRPAVAK
jgi:hypothetical protein